MSKIKELLGRILTEENKQKLIKRLKSFLWRTLCTALIALVAFIGDNLSLFNLHPIVIVLIGNALSEVTKWLNSHTDLFGARQKK